MKKGILAAFCFAASFLPLLAAGANLGGIEVTPPRLQISARQPIQTVELTNNDVAIDLFQIHVSRWTQQNGKDVLSPTDDLIVSPLIFSLQPGARQVLRIGSRIMPDASTERTYRVFIKQLNAPVKARMGIAFQMEFALPVFLQPSAAGHPLLSCSLAGSGRNRGLLTIANAGNIHAQVSQLWIKQAGTGHILFAGTLASYVLAHETRAFPIKFAVPNELFDLAVELHTDDGVVQVPLIPAGR